MVSKPSAASKKNVKTPSPAMQRELDRENMNHAHDETDPVHLEKLARVQAKLEIMYANRPRNIDGSESRVSI